MKAQKIHFSITSFFSVGQTGRGGRDHGGAALTSTAARLDAASHGETGKTQKPDGGATLTSTAARLDAASHGETGKTQKPDGGAAVADALIPRITKTITPERTAELDKAHDLAVRFARHETLSGADFDFLGLYLVKTIKAAILSANGWRWHEEREFLNDLVYDAYIKVIKCLERFTGNDGRLSSYVGMIAKHYFYDVMANRRRKQAEELDHFNYLCSVYPEYRASIAENWIMNTED